MIRVRKTALMTVCAATIGFSSAAKADFCQVQGSSPQDYAANVLKSKAFKRIGGTARFAGYFNRKYTLYLIVTKPGHPAHPAASCTRVSSKTSEWELVTSRRCEASRKACDVLLADWKVLFAQWGKNGLKY